MNTQNNTLDAAYGLLDQINAHIKVYEDAETYKQLIDAPVAKLALVERVEGEEYDNITYLPLTDKDMADIKEYAKQLITARAKESIDFLNALTKKDSKQAEVANVPEQKKKTIEIDDAKLLEMSAAGMSAAEIAREIGCAHSTAWNRLKAAQERASRSGK